MDESNFGNAAALSKIALGQPVEARTLHYGGENRGRIAVVGAGPAGMAAALAAHRAGFDVSLYERYHEIKAAGNILNLWPPPQKVLRSSRCRYG